VLATVERLEADQEDYMREREAELLTLFKAFDKDQDGQIVAEELQHVLTEATKRYYSTDEASLILQKADKDNNGLINFDELVDFLVSSP
jgi:Ca2+-binding EF-hand superfamily protein